jgi:uncharacterized protein (TIGR02246 family)
MEPNEESAVRDLVDSFAVAWNRHDGPALAALFTEDGDFVNVIGRWAQGRAAIAAVLNRNHPTIFRESHLAQTNVTIRSPRPEVAIVHARWNLSGERGQQDEVLPPRQGIITLLLTKEPGGWRIAAFQNTDILALPA